MKIWGVMKKYISPDGSGILLERRSTQKIKPTAGSRLLHQLILETIFFNASLRKPTHTLSLYLQPD